MSVQFPLTTNTHEIGNDTNLTTNINEIWLLTLLVNYYDWARPIITIRYIHKSVVEVNADAFPYFRPIRNYLRCLTKLPHKALRTARSKSHPI